MQTLISSRSSSKSRCVRNTLLSLFIRSALWTKFRSVHPKANSLAGNLYLAESPSSIVALSSIFVGKVLMFYRKALFKTDTALKTPIVVSIASSGIPSPVQTAPVVVWKESVYG